MDIDSTSLSSQELCRGLESLPQELYDIIYKEVFTAPPGVRYNKYIASRTSLNWHQISAPQRHLKFFQVSRASRELYAKTYYGPGAIFRIDSCRAFGVDDVRIWLDSIPKGHLVYLHRVVLCGASMQGWFLSDEAYLGCLRTYVGILFGAEVAAKMVMEVEGGLVG